MDILDAFDAELQKSTGKSAFGRGAILPKAEFRENLKVVVRFEE